MINKRKEQEVSQIKQTIASALSESEQINHQIQTQAKDLNGKTIKRDCLANDLKQLNGAIIEGNAVNARQSGDIARLEIRF